MEQMTLLEIAQAIGCETNENALIHDISTDSRALPSGCLFLALEGERFNGHDYVAQALVSGAAFAVIHQDCETGGADPARLLRVANTQDALLAIGGHYRDKFEIDCVGVTGSVGKTTTKDMIAQVVAAGRKTLKTQGNLNNEIGLPKTLLELDFSHQAAVIEMGMQGLGEIAMLASAAKPTIGVITNIGVSHLEQLGTRENILRAKLELAEALPDGAPLLLCADNDLLRTVRIPRLRILRYGLEQEENDLSARELSEQDGETHFTICCADTAFAEQTLHAVIPCVGRHNVCNALAAFGVGRLLGIPAQACLEALRGYQPSGMRQKVVRWSGSTVVEDCYNASPDSMRAALQTLGAYSCTGKRIAVLGDMLELGSIAEQSHYDVGAFAGEQKIDLLLAFGEQAKAYVSGAEQAGLRAMWFSDKSELTLRLRQEMTGGSVVWVKGSRGMKLEDILSELYQG